MIYRISAHSSIFLAMIVRVFYILFLSCMCVSCSIRSVYLPVSQNVAMFDSAKELQGSLYLSANHIELQAATNPGKQIAVATNINFGNGITVYDVSIGWHGYTHSTTWRYEIFGGFGYNVNSLYPGSNDALFFTRNGGDFRVSALYQRCYVQPAVGYCGTIDAYGLNYFFALSARTSALHFNDFTFRQIDHDHTTDPDHPVYLIDRQYTNAVLYLLEPALPIR